MTSAAIRELIAAATSRRRRRARRRPGAARACRTTAPGICWPLDGDAVVGYLESRPGADEDPRWPSSSSIPRARRRGIGSALVRAALAEGGDGTRIWAHGNLEAAAATAAALGLKPVRELLQMRRPLTRPAAGDDPGRRAHATPTAAPDDDAELLRVNNAAFAWHPEQGGWTEADIAERRGRAVVRPRRVCSWRSTSRPASCSASTGRRCTTTDLGEVYVVGVDPAAQGRGLGATLTLVGLHHLAERLRKLPADGDALRRGRQLGGGEHLSSGWVSRCPASTSAYAAVKLAVPSWRTTLNLFTVRSPSIQQPSTAAAYVAGESEARQSPRGKWDK